MSTPSNRPTRRPIGKVHRSRLSNTDMKKPRRLGPGGKLALVSDEAVESMAADMEKRTRKAIGVIGRSIGF